MKFNKQGFILSALYHIILLGLLLLFGFSPPFPLPAEQGFLIDFGTTDKGRGNIEPVNTQTEPVKKQAETRPVEKNFVTQDIEEAPTLPDKKETQKKQTPQVTEKVIEQKKNVEEEIKEERKPNPLANFGQYKNSVSNQGVSTEDGNKGAEDGGEKISHFIGNTESDGYAYSLTGRSPTNIERPTFECQKEGVVIVRISVDRSGKVIRADAGVKAGTERSTTLDNCLLKAAERAALNSAFNAKSTAEYNQIGYIKYVFKLE